MLTRSGHCFVLPLAPQGPSVSESSVVAHLQVISRMSLELMEVGVRRLFDIDIYELPRAHDIEAGE